MQTRVSTKGQIVLLGPLRRKLGIRAGDPLDASIEESSLRLTPREKVLHKVEIVTSPITGLPLLSAEDDSPILTSLEVEEILSSFP